MSTGVKCKFRYHVPENLSEALELLKKYENDSKVIAGGTDLIPKIKAGVVQFGNLISLKKIEELKGCSFDEKDGLRIGSMELLRDTENSDVVKKHYPALYTGIHSMANTQVRNRGTITGNICNAVPSADTAPALIVYDAKVVIVSSEGERIVPITEFFTGVCRTVLKADEIVKEILIPVPAETSVSAYYKYTIRNALDLAMIGVAVNVEMDGKIVKDVKIALGAVAIVPKRAPKAEALLLGRELTEELIEEAARVASQEDCTPISDIRATAEYRREMVRVNLRDALKLAL